MQSGYILPKKTRWNRSGFLSILCGNFPKIGDFCQHQQSSTHIPPSIHPKMTEGKSLGLPPPTMYDFHDSTDTLKFWTEKRPINKTFFVFHPILIKLGEVVVIHVYYNFTKFHQNRMKTKKVLLIAHFSVQNFKVSVELWKSYIVPLYNTTLIKYVSWLIFQNHLQAYYQWKSFGIHEYTS